MGVLGRVVVLVVWRHSAAFCFGQLWLADQPDQLPHHDGLYPSGLFVDHGLASARLAGRVLLGPSRQHLAGVAHRLTRLFWCRQPAAFVRLAPQPAALARGDDRNECRLRAGLCHRL